MPLVLQLTPGQELEYARIADELNAYGFETEPFGQRTVAIKAAPAGVGPADIEKILFEILEIAESELRSHRSMKFAGMSAPPLPAGPRSKSTPSGAEKDDWLLRALANCEYP